MTPRQIAPDGAPSKNIVPAIEGWFTLDEAAPALVGSRCTACGTIYFPAESYFCKKPTCASSDFTSVPLSRRGRIWSYTDSQYRPPPPYVSADPYVPFALVAVELAAEKMVVMGQTVAGISTDQLAVGDEVELVLETLYEDDDNEYLVWKWKPVARTELSATRPVVESGDSHE